VYQVQDDNDFAVKRNESVLLSNDVKGLLEVPWNPLNAPLPRSAPVLYFNHNHNNSDSLTNKYTKKLGIFN